ncbi:MAG: phosphatase PAP2 family protein [Actinomycetota bacterium]|nr:phosphatase PAP2 family protein [Actinomycetota bacterium]
MTATRGFAARALGRAVADAAQIGSRRGATARRGSRASRVRPWFLAYAAGVVALSGSRRRLGLPRPPMVPLATTVPMAVGAAFPRGRLQHAATWAAYVWLFKVAWEIPYDDPEKLGRHLRLHYPIRIDAAIGAGTPPGVRLQRALRDPARLTALDYALTAVYHAGWLAPHAVLGWLLLRHPERVPRVAGRLAGTYHLTTLGYWYLPTAPPWWASEREGLMNGEIQHVGREVRHAIATKLGSSRDAGDDFMELGNPWGSMPSDAIPGAVVTARSLAQINPAAGAAAWGGTALLAFSVVYLGEHYVTDVIAGLALAEAVWRAEPAMLPLVRIGLGVLRELERRVT